MSETATWALAGPGMIGREAMRQLGQQHVADRLGLESQPSFVMRTDGIYEADCETPTSFQRLEDVDELPDVTFVALPSSDDGEVAYGLMSHILQRDKMVVTAEKGGLANFFHDLKADSDDFARLGVNATVGGGTRMLGVAREYCQDKDNITQIHLALNGTLSAVMALVGPRDGIGASPGQAVEQAALLGYAEPASDGGAINTFDVIRAEAEGDIPKKTAILFNVLGLGKYLDWNLLRQPLEDEDIAHVIDEAKVRRYIVSLYSEKFMELAGTRPENDSIGGFSEDHDGWRVMGGFRNVDRNPLFGHIASTSGPGNCLVIGLGPNESDGVYAITGPGAGVKPTVNTMIDDFVSMSRRAR